MDSHKSSRGVCSLCSSRTSFEKEWFNTQLPHRRQNRAENLLCIHRLVQRVSRARQRAERSVSLSATIPRSSTSEQAGEPALGFDKLLHPHSVAHTARCQGIVRAFYFLRGRGNSRGRTLPPSTRVRGQTSLVTRVLSRTVPTHQQPPHVLGHARQYNRTTGKLHGQF